MLFVFVLVIFSRVIVPVVVVLVAEGAGDTIDADAEAQLGATAKPEVRGRSSTRSVSCRTFPGALCLQEKDEHANTL